MAFCCTVLCLISDAEVGPDAADAVVVDQRLPADNRRQRKQRPVTVHDSTVLTARLRAGDAGRYT